MDAFDAQGQRIILGNQVGRGGEGTVYAVPNLATAPDSQVLKQVGSDTATLGLAKATCVAKIYHLPLTPEHAAKLEAMVEQRDADLDKIAAWPEILLYQRRGGPVIGFTMPRVSGYQEMHHLYGPKSRLQAFPEANFAFLLHTAANLARAFATVHAKGNVIGDVNHANAQVSRHATVMLIDCDSFQIRDPRTGRPHLCTVGVSTHQPPEFQTPDSFAGKVRTPNHDNFGLAVLIFQLLFMGRHPFAGRFLGKGDLPLERAIREGRFAYSVQAATLQMQPPPGTLPTTAVGSLAALFDAAFRSQGALPPTRPTASEWVTALSALAQQLRACSANSSHTFPTAAGICPWCQIEAATGTLLFGVRLSAVPSVGGDFQLTTIWAQIEAVAPPGAAQPLPTTASLNKSPIPEARRIGRARRARVVFGIVFALVGLLGSVAGAGFWSAVVAGGVAWWVASAGRKAERQQYDVALADATRDWNALRLRWEQEVGEGTFRARVLELERARTEYLDLPARRQRRLRQLESQLFQRQRQQYLDRYRIAHAQISGIGQGLVTTLISYGIETAADVTEARVMGVPGFGPSRTHRVLQWRHTVEGRFHFDPSKGVTTVDVASVDQEIVQTRARLERTLRAGPVDLQRIAQHAKARRQALLPLLGKALAQVAQAEADRAAL